MKHTSQKNKHAKHTKQTINQQKETFQSNDSAPSPQSADLALHLPAGYRPPDSMLAKPLTRQTAHEPMAVFLKSSEVRKVYDSGLAKSTQPIGQPMTLFNREPSWTLVEGHAMPSKHVPKRAQFSSWGCSIESGTPQKKKKNMFPLKTSQTKNDPHTFWQPARQHSRSRQKSLEPSLSERWDLEATHVCSPCIRG